MKTVSFFQHELTYTNYALYYITISIDSYMFFSKDTANCSLWYYSMPESIVCRDGTHFSTACQVKAPCGVKTNVTWYWSPQDTSNSTYIIRDSNNTRMRALHSQTDSCTNNSVLLHHIYTLTLAGLSSKNAGFYWCQLEIAEEKESNAAARNLLPSDKCRVEVDDKLVGCEYGEHKDEWKCAQTLATVTNEDSEDVDAYGSRAPELLATVQRPSPTVTLHDTSGRKTPPIKMQWTVMEVVLFVVVLLCVAIIVLLLVCVFIKRKRKRAGNDN